MSIFGVSSEFNSCDSHCLSVGSNFQINDFDDGEIRNGRAKGINSQNGMSFNEKISSYPFNLKLQISMCGTYVRC